jgi:hypothetical protein
MGSSKKPASDAAAEASAALIAAAGLLYQDYPVFGGAQDCVSVCVARGLFWPCDFPPYLAPPELPRP